MVTTDAIEGTVNQHLWFHYDLGNDVLYIRRSSMRGRETYAEETPDGALLLRCEDSDEVAGLTVVNWWKRFGAGSPPDSLRELSARIEPFAVRLAA
jgi:hypothetical protein